MGELEKDRAEMWQNQGNLTGLHPAPEVSRHCYRCVVKHNVGIYRDGSSK